MRYQNLFSFEKHVQEAAPDHLAKRYFLILPDDYERKREIQKLLQVFGQAPSKRVSKETHSIQEMIEEMSPGLFDLASLFVLEDMELLTKKEWQLLKGNLPEKGVFIFAAKKKGELRSDLEKEGVVLDLSEEKPWEKEKRLFSHALFLLGKEKKKIHPDLLSLFFSRVGLDPATLDSEIEKLVTFLGETKEIEKAHILAVSSQSEQDTLFSLAEAIIWKRRVPAFSKDFNLHAFFPILRMQLEIGIKIGSLLNSSVPFDQWAEFLPKIWPKTLEKRRFTLQKWGVLPFQKGLKSLFDLELLSRSGSSNLDAMLECFVWKWL